MGTESGLTVLELRDPVKFRKSLDLLAAAWESLADQLNLYVRFQSMEQVDDVAGVPVTLFVPRFRFGIPARHMEFRERMKEMYGPEGLIYRVAIVGNQAVISSGSDIGMLTQTLENLKSGKTPERSPAQKRMESHLPGRQSLAIAMSLPLFLSQSLIRGGTPLEKIGSLDPGQEIVGVAVQSDGLTARVVTFVPHEQIRLALEMLKRAAPDISELPHTLFEPTQEGPPQGARLPGKAAPPSTPPAKAPAPKAPAPGGPPSASPAPPPIAAPVPPAPKP
jgi:hypothetical protein